MRDCHPAPEPGAAERLARFQILQHLVPVEPVGIGEQLRRGYQHPGLAVDLVEQNRLRRECEVYVHFSANPD